jgi:RNA polymerase sigma-70 factor (ECF subfamily)
MERADRRETFAEPSDDALIVQAQGGDRPAFDRLVKRYQRRIYYLALRMAKDHDAADDIAQETFVKAYFAIQTFTVGRAFYTWLYRICMNLSLDHLKRGRHAIPASRLGGDDAGDPLEVEAPGDDPSEALITKDRVAKVETAIDTLPSKFKAVLVLRVYEEMSYEDIAAALDLSVGTVMSRLFRARKKLLELLAE